MVDGAPGFAGSRTFFLGSVDRLTAQLFNFNFKVPVSCTKVGFRGSRQEKAKVDSRPWGQASDPKGLPVPLLGRAGGKGGAGGEW